MASNETQHNELHFNFIEMLFALAAAEVAVQAGKLVDSGQISLKNILPIVPCFTHILLSLMVIVLSWVGWGRSKHGPSSEAAKIFNWEFVELLIDVFLVVCYFVLAHGVETSIKNTPPKVNPINEIYLFCIIMVTYLIWDLVSKRENLERIVQRGWASLCCATLAVGSSYYFLLWNSEDPLVVASIDLSFLSLCFLFRAMKLRDLRNHTKRSWTRIASLLIIWLAFVRTARVLQDQTLFKKSPLEILSIYFGIS